MKTAFTVSSVLITLLILTGCLLEPGTGGNGGGPSSAVSSSSSSVSSGGSSPSSSSSTPAVEPAIITVNIVSAVKGNIVIPETTITQVVMVLSNPSGSAQQKRWIPGDTNIQVFYSYESGTHGFTAISFDDIGSIDTNSIIFSVTTGSNHLLTLSLGF